MRGPVDWPHNRLFLDILSINVYFPSKSMINKNKHSLQSVAFLQAKVSTWEMVKSGWENACTAADLQMGTLQFFTQPCCHAWYLSGTPQSVVPKILQFSCEKNVRKNFVENSIFCVKKNVRSCSQLICLIPASDIRPCLKCHLRNTPHPPPLKMCKALAL